MDDPIRTGGDNPFAFREPKPSQLVRMHYVRTKAALLYRTIMEHAKPSRERSLAITKLEEAGMWANKAIALEAEVWGFGFEAEEGQSEPAQG